MYKMLKIFFLLLAMPISLIAQIIPREGSALNYRIIGFSVPLVKQVTNYKIQIAQGNYNDEASFRKNITITTTAKKNKIIAEVPAFGKQYTWRAVYNDSHSKTTTSQLYHFSTMMAPQVNPDSVRLRIVNQAVKHQGDYVFVDGNKALYDMQGHPVWFLPDVDSTIKWIERPRDMKLTPFGTITFLVGERIYEINYNSDILWKGPENARMKRDSAHLNNLHHHEFTRLANGNYMALAFEQTLWQLPAPLDSQTFATLHGKIKRDSNNKFYQKILFGTLVEFDGLGNLVWKWSGSDYFKKSDLYSHLIKDEFFDIENTHANAFYFDEKTNVIYISYRDINRIVKIEYPSGKVLNTYGKLYTPGGPGYLINGLFCGQHGCRESREGYLYMFNNNICDRQSNPTALMLQQPKTAKDSLKKVWEYECPVDEVTDKERAAIIFNSGGNVYELAESSMFVCMGSTYGKVFIVSRNKQMLWCARAEKWNDKEKKWANEGSYRASIISRKGLENLIWNEPLKN